MSAALSVRDQSRVLSARYWACMRGDWPTVFLLLAQAPFIGWLCTLVWGSIERDTPSLYFVMCLSAVWFGCINACREIVKERAILERERIFGLSVAAYTGSRFAILAWIGLAQVLMLQIAVEWRLALRGPFLIQTAAMWGASLCGNGLGLLVSAVARTQERAVGMVPLLILPQILFSDFAIPRESCGRAVEIIEWFMPVRWAYRVFSGAAESDPSWLTVAGSLAVLPIYAVVLSLLVIAALAPRREV